MSSINALIVQGGVDNPTPIPVSGTVTSTPATGSTWTVAGTVAATQSGVWTVGGTVSVNNTVTVQPAGGTTWTVAGTVTTVPSGTQTVSGTVSVGNTVTVTPAPATTWTTSVSNTVTVTPAPATTWTVAGTVTVGGTTTVQLTPTVTSSDTLANPTAPQEISHVHEYNAANAQWQRRQAPSHGTLLALAARTLNTTTATVANPNFPRLRLLLNVTAASGTGGLTLRLQGIDPVGGGFATFFQTGKVVIATGFYAYDLGPGAFYIGGTPPGIVDAQQLLIPDQWRVVVVVGDTSSYTYSLGYFYCS